MAYSQEVIAELAESIKSQGFRVFLAKSGTYGFFTDNKGRRVISFQHDLNLTFSGNYTTSNPEQCGTGWRISDDTKERFAELFNAAPPQWAVRGAKWRYTSLECHLTAYQKSSQYKEV